MKTQRLILMLGLVSVLSSGCAYQHRALLKPNIPIAQKTNSDQSKKIILSALSARGWNVVEEGSGYVTARQDRGGHSATVKVTYGSDHVDITYVDSTNLRFRDQDGRQTIHSRYNVWVRNLARTIRKGFLNDGRAGARI